MKVRLQKGVFCCFFDYFLGLRTIGFFDFLSVYPCSKHSHPFYRHDFVVDYFVYYFVYSFVFLIGAVASVFLSFSVSAFLFFFVFGFFPIFFDYYFFSSHIVFLIWDILVFVFFIFCRCHYFVGKIQLYFGYNLARRVPSLSNLVTLFLLWWYWWYWGLW